MNLPSASPTPSRLQRLGHYLAADPDNTALLHDYAGQAWATREYQACAIALRKLLTLEPPTPQRHAELARALLASGDLEQALQVAEAALTQWPDDANLQLSVAQCHLAARDFEQALEAQPMREAALPLSGEACALRIRALHHLGQLEQAAREAAAHEAVTGLHPAVGSALLPVLTDLSRFEEATALASSLLQAAGDKPPPYEVCEPLALAALDNGQDAAARQWVDRALDTRRDDGRIWLLDGMTSMQTGSWDRAATAFEHAVQLMPGHAGSHLAQGWMHLLRNELDAARSCFERGVAASPAFAEGHGSLAVVAARQGHSAEADALIRKALLLDRHCGSARFAQALQRGASQDKIAELAKAVITRARTNRAAPQ
jgi:tetratricopeptide (TPR) repeat protein